MFKLNFKSFQKHITKINYVLFKCSNLPTLENMKCNDFNKIRCIILYYIYCNDEYF